jgi:hypothetical protein
MKIIEPKNNYERHPEGWNKKQLEEINRQIEEIERDKARRYKLRTPITPKNKKIRKTYFA